MTDHGPFLEARLAQQEPIDPSSSCVETANVTDEAIRDRFHAGFPEIVEEIRAQVQAD